MSPESTRALVETVARVLGPATGGTADVQENYDHPIAVVPVEQWIAALTAARDELGATFLDWLTGVDELEDGYTIAAFVCAPADAVSLADSGSTAGEVSVDDTASTADAAKSADVAKSTGSVSNDEPSGARLRRGQGVLVKTRVPRDQAELPSATTVYRGANWHERETFEMFGVVFTGHPDLKPLLLPDGFEGHPLRKDFILASRVAKAWPGAKEPGESDHDHRASPGRRRMLPPGVPGEGWLKPLPATSTATAPAQPGAVQTETANTGAANTEAANTETVQPPAGEAEGDG